MRGATSKYPLNERVNLTAAAAADREESLFGVWLNGGMRTFSSKLSAKPKRRIAHTLAILPQPDSHPQNASLTTERYRGVCKVKRTPPALYTDTLAHSQTYTHNGTHEWPPKQTQRTRSDDFDADVHT